MIRAFLESIHVFAAEVDKSTLFLHKGTSNGMIALLPCNIEEDCIILSEYEGVPLKTSLESSFSHSMTKVT